MSKAKCLPEQLDDIVDEIDKFIVDLHKIKDKIRYLLPSPYDEPCNFPTTCLHTIELGLYCTEEKHHQSCFRYELDVKDVK